MQPAADKTYMLFGLAKFTLLLMLTLLAAFSHKVNPTVFDLSPSSPLHFMQATPSGSARSDALATSSPLHFMQATSSSSARSDALAASSPLRFMQATPSGSVRSDALAASSPLHFMQATPSGSARSDALAASSPLHFRQGHYLLTIGPTKSISVNLDDPGSAEGGEDDVASTPDVALATTTSTPALVKFRSPSRTLLVADMLSLSALQTIPLPPKEPPPCKIEGVCPGSRLDNPLAPCQLLLSLAPLAAAAELQAAAASASPARRVASARSR
ncbi:hypothetical protein T492DRAFT_280889 [Pavlovales sp. CCMP2436]|nr:hypothetical protein T492DRAFT_280889 [Pavlovales sp. CCMP2436]